MSTFVFGALLLAVVAALCLLWPRDGGPRRADLDDPNLQWYRQRRAELDDGAGAALLEEAQLRLLDEGAGAAPDAATPPGAGGARGLRWALLPLLLVGAALLYTRLGAFEDVLIYRAIENFDSADPAAAAALAERIARRSAARPENLQYLDLLGQLQFGGEDFAAAAATRTRLAELAPNDPAVQAQAAQSRFLAAGRRLDEQAQLFAERALALDPEQAMALGLLGMAAFEQGQFNAAIVYWERLQAQEQPGSPEYQLLADVIGVARTRAGGDATAATAAADGEAPGLTVALALAEDAEVAGDATVFVFARSPAAQTRMPIAVRRLRAGDLPLTLRLSDADSMAGQLLSSAGAVVVSAQLSRNGQPGMANAAYAGSSEAVAAGGADARVQVELRAVDGDS